MSRIAQFNASKQPNMAQRPDSLIGWTDGPLPKPALERAAFDLFTDDHPNGLWAEDGYSAERNRYRRQVVRLYARFRVLERWTLSTMTDCCEQGMREVVCGDAGCSETQRRVIRDYAESCIEGLFRLVGGDEAVVNGLRRMHASRKADVATFPAEDADDDEQSRQAAFWIAETLANLSCGIPFQQLEASDRVWLQQQTDQLIEDALKRFTSHPGDPEYQPQEEPEYYDEVQS
jgi:hypothetical protein